MPISFHFATDSSTLHRKLGELHQDKENKTITVHTNTIGDLIQGSILTVPFPSGSHQQKQCASEYLHLRLDDYGNPHRANFQVFIPEINISTLGFCTAVMGQRTGTADFWKMIAYAERHGFHKIRQSCVPETEINRLNAWYAWFEENLNILQPAPDSEIDSADDHIYCAQCALEKIFADDHTLLKKGKDYMNRQKERCKKSFIEKDGIVLCRFGSHFGAETFVDPLTEDVAQISLHFNDGALEMYFAYPSARMNALKFFQTMHDKRCTGSDQMARTPSGVVYGLNDFTTLWNVILEQRGSIF